MSRPLTCKAKVAFEGVDVFYGTERVLCMSAGDAIDLYRSLKRNMKRIKKNAQLWRETP